MKTPSDNDVVQTAAEWLLRLDSPGMDSAEVRAAFETWQNADPRHREATQTMQPLVNQMRQWQQAPADERIAAGHALRSRPGRAGVRRTLSGITLGLLLLLVGSGWWWGQGLPASAWLADASTAAGETRELSLADGSRVLLGGGTALSFDRSADRRRLTLHAGDVMVEVARDAERPFTVTTRHGEVVALGTRFLVRQRLDGTEVVMLESRTRATPAQGGDAREVVAGERVRLHQDRVELLQPVDVLAEQGSFERQRLVVQDRPLTEVLSEIARQRPGALYVETDALAGIRFTGVLPLDDTDMALQLLVTSFPQMRVRMLTPWLVRVDAPPGHITRVE